MNVELRNQCKRMGLIYDTNNKDKNTDCMIIDDIPNSSTSRTADGVKDSKVGGVPVGIRKRSRRQLWDDVICNKLDSGNLFLKLNYFDGRLYHSS